MKKYFYVCMLFFSFCCMSCFEDDSSLEIRELNPIRIENIALNGSYSVYMGDTLEIEPLVFCEGIPDADLSFEWQLSGGTIVPTILDSTMYMSAQIIAPPANQPYLLKFTVTDNTTGIVRMEKFNVTVRNTYAKGLIVADTKDGINSDLSLIQSREFDSDIPQNNSEKKIFRHLWSQNNGSSLEGTVLDCATYYYGTSRYLMVMTTKHIYSSDFIDYINIPERQDENIFALPLEHIDGDYSHGGFCEEPTRSIQLLNADGLLTARSMAEGFTKYNYTVYPSGIPNYDITLMHSTDWTPVFCYDAYGEQLLFFNSDRELCKAVEQVNADELFDINDLSDYEPFLMDEMPSGVVILAKQKSTGAFVGLLMNGNGDEGYGYDETSRDFAKDMFDFSSATDIDQAKFFDVHSLEDVIYYASETALYAVPTASMIATEQWKVPVGSGEKITGIRVYDFETGGSIMYGGVDDRGNPVNRFQPSSCGMVMIFTYNEATQEGKITCVPITSRGRGGLEQDRAYHVTFPGFDKIIDVYCQIK